MTDYSKTIIYKIFHNVNHDLVYVGSTTNFTRRKYEHKKNSISHHYKLYKTIRENGGWDCFNMLQVKVFPCNNKREANLEENNIMKELNSNMHSNIAFRNHKEYLRQYNIDNKEILSQKAKEYNEKNKEKITENKKRYYEENKEKFIERARNRYEKNKEKINEKCVCELCGLILSKKSLTRHNKRKH